MKKDLDSAPALILGPEELPAARAMMFLFGGVTAFVVLLAGTLFYSSTMVWSATIPSVLWSFFGIGTISALCTVTLQHWIKISILANSNEEIQ